MKITDESVAKALGWKSKLCGVNHCQERSWTKPNSRQMFHGHVPPFTTSLEAIVAEIEARKLEWYVSHRWNMSREFDGYNAFVEFDESRQTGDTAAEALCRSLLAYLKESNRG